MHSHTTEPTPCAECGHLVYRPLVASVCHPQRACRAVLPEQEGDAPRCGCTSAVHRVPAVRPRHRLTEARAG